MSPDQISFHTMYLELILDNLLRHPPHTALWCAHAIDHFTRSAGDRTKYLWTVALPAAAFLDA
jgi:hypothetical protein